MSATVKTVTLRNTELAVCHVLLYGTEEAKQQILTEVTQEEFSGANTQKVFLAARSLMDDGLTISSVSVKERSGVLPESELLSMAEVGQVQFDEASVSSLCRELRRASAIRHIHRSVAEVHNSISRDSDPNALTDILERGLYASAARTGQADVSDGKDVVAKFMVGFMERAAGNGQRPMSTGYKDLDRMIIGLRPKKFYVIAGRPAMGKTAFVKGLRRSVIAQGFSSADFSLEMCAEEHAEREVAELANINLMKVLTGSGLSQEEIARAVSIPDSIASGRWFIEDSCYSINSIMRKARVLARKCAKAGRPLRLIVIDYIQLATGSDEENAQASVAKFSRGCKLLSKELDCAVVGLSQLNRNCEYREDKRPLMADLRESGAIEQDADLVAFLYRDAVYNSAADPHEAEFIIRKQRSGPIGTVQLHWEGRTVSFSDCRKVDAVGSNTVSGPTIQ